MKKVPLQVEESALDIFTSNLSPILAYEVQQCWIDPQIIRIGNLLGHGEYNGDSSQLLTTFRNMTFLRCFQFRNIPLPV